MQLEESDTRLAFAMFDPTQAGVKGACGGQIGDAKRDERDALVCHGEVTCETPP
jgi:hypothetical protein